MNTDYEKIKSDLLKFGKENGACVEQYQRLYKAESIEDVIAVVKDNFWWCAKYRDFPDVIMANREQFSDHKIWVNEDVVIREGVGYLMATDGAINATSRDTSTINATSYGTSTINATSCNTSTMLIRTSSIECKVKDHSIARYVYENRIVVADDSMKLEIYK